MQVSWILFICLFILILHHCKIHATHLDSPRTSVKLKFYITFGLASSWVYLQILLPRPVYALTAHFHPYHFWRLFSVALSLELLPADVICNSCSAKSRLSSDNFISKHFCIQHTLYHQSILISYISLE
jgi:hypothetical protein